MSRSIKWLFAMMLTLSVGIDVAAGAGSTKDYAWLLFLKVNEPPVVDAGMDQTITWAADSVYLDATVTDDPRDALTYTWTKLDDPGYLGFSSANAEDTTATLSTPGTYPVTHVFQLSVSDGLLTSESTVTIILHNDAPDVNIVRDTISTVSEVTLTPIVTDDSSDKLIYQWTKDSGPVNGIATFSEPVSKDTIVSFDKAGTYVLKLWASDGDLAATDIVTVVYLPQHKVDVIVAVGDSITVGVGDGGCTDKSCAGYTPKLKSLLDNERGYTHTIWEEGKKGETSRGGRLRIPAIIADHGNADQYLVMYGTNDADPWLVPLITPAVFKYNMQKIIDAIKAAGAQPVLAKAPYAKNNYTYKNEYILEFNGVIDDLVRINSITVLPPRFFKWFVQHTGEISSDNLHPNTDGYWSMSEVWQDCLLGYGSKYIDYCGK